MTALTTRPVCLASVRRSLTVCVRVAAPVRARIALQQTLETDLITIRPAKAGRQVVAEYGLAPVLSAQLHGQRIGLPLADAYRAALAFTGRIVALVGLTLAAGVITWAWSPIKFQADMGILLAFMFLLNMLGALILIPALSCFLLPTSAVRHRAAAAGDAVPRPA